MGARRGADAARAAGRRWPRTCRRSSARACFARIRETLAGEDGFRFAHILVRDAAYDSMPKRLRGELHERFADWVEIRARERPELDEILGHHLEQARALRLELQPGGPEEEALAIRAFEPLTRAGRRALGRGDLHAARGLLERAVALLPEDDHAGSS